MTHKYVLGFLFHKNKILMIQRTKEDWQYGTVNGIGGKMEFSETRLNAMIREFNEEVNNTSISPVWHFVFSLIYPDTNSTIYIFRGFSKDDFSHLNNTIVNEGVLKVFDVEELITNKEIKKTEAVDWLVPLCNSPFSRLSGSFALWNDLEA